MIVFYKYAQNMMMKNNARMTLFNFISSPSENYHTERNVSEHLFIKVYQIKSGDFKIEGKFVTSDS